MSGLLQRLIQKQSRPAAPSPVPEITDPRQAAEALALAREILLAVEQFVISTPDLDSDRFLQRVRGTAAGLTPRADAPTLQLYGQWARKALAAFASLQRRYLGERDEEMWRLLDVYAQTVAASQGRGSELITSLRESHSRMRALTSLPDLREAREALTKELGEARRLVEEKFREDKERSAGLARQVSQLEQTLSRLRGQADYDVLTGILHRGAFLHALGKLLASGQTCAVALVDLDRFRQINDTLGQVVADRLLLAVTEQLRRCSRTTDLLGRYGGDEFGFAAPGFTAEQLAHRLAGAVTRRHVRLELDERVCSVLLSMSVGISVSQRGEPVHAVLERAQGALRSVQQGGKGGVRLAA